MTVTYQDVLEFWFDELTPKDWFTGGEEIDVLIMTRFLNYIKVAIQGELLNGVKTRKGVWLEDYRS
ncbi:DUF924 family protein [Vibrio lentus]|nr:DUF924 family protein [Vibrio lentus]